MFLLRPWQLLMIGLTFLPCAFSQSCEQRNGFKDGEQSEFRVEYHETKRGGKRQVSYTHAMVKWDPNAMLTDNIGCYDLQNVLLQYSIDSNSSMDNEDSKASSNGAQRNWTTAGNETYKRNKWWREWKVKVVPCLKYDFKIVVTSKDDKNEIYETSLKTLSPATQEMIEKSRYVPEKPKFVGAQSIGTKTKLKFEPSPCVDSYFLYLKEMNSENEIERDYIVDQSRDISLDDTNLTIELHDLTSCTEYETASLSAKISDRDSEEEVFPLITKPNGQTSENIQLLRLENGTDSFSFALDSPWKPKLSCIQEYQIEICSDKVDKGCSDKSIEKRTADNPTLETTKNDLTPCTKYELKITPMYEDVTIQPKSFPFETTSDTNSPCPITTTQDGKLV